MTRKEIEDDLALVRTALTDGEKILHEMGRAVTNLRMKLAGTALMVEVWSKQLLRSTDESEPAPEPETPGSN